MSKFIERKFPQNIPQTAQVSSQVHGGQFDLIGPDGDVIAPDFWEELIEPGWTVTMNLWPLHMTAEVIDDSQPSSTGAAEQNSSEPELKRLLSEESRTCPSILCHRYQRMSRAQIHYLSRRVLETATKREKHQKPNLRPPHPQ
jgi:hypothetical protein